MQFGKDAVYYTNGATEAEGRAVGNSLTKIGLFQGVGAAAKIAKKGNDYALSFAVLEGVWYDPKVVSELTEAGQKVSEEVFPDQVVVLQLSNDHFEAQKKVILSDRQENTESGAND